MNTLWRDLQYGFRMLRNKPGFTTAAVLVLALGIGANSAVFSLVNAFLLKPLYLQKPEELVGLYSRDARHPDNYRAFSYRNYVDVRDNNPVFAGLMAHNLAMVGLQEGETTRRTFVDVVSSNYFSTLGVPLVQGRAFTAAEERSAGGEPPVIASYSYWNKARDPQLLGKQLRINGRLFTVIGITPEGFTGTEALFSPELFLPLNAYNLVMNDFEGHGKLLGDRSNAALIVVGRLKPGVNKPSADSRLGVIASRMEKEFPVENKDQVLLVSPIARLSITTNPSNDDALRIPALLLLCLAGIILIIASLNLANMMMVRGAARRKEIAVRLAIGGGRRQIIRQLVTEGVLLAIMGGAVGLFAAFWSTTVLMGSLAHLAPVEFVYDARPDVRVLAVTLGYCALSTIIFGLFPAWKFSRPDVWFDLKDSTGEELGTASRHLFSRSNVLVMGQLALSLMMLAAAGLFVHSAVEASNVQPGFALENEVIAEVDASLVSYDESRGRRAYAEVEHRLSQLPGVESVGFAATTPFGMVSLGKSVTPSEAGASKTRPAVSARFNIVSEDYFRAMQIPLLQGRPFRVAETMPQSKSSVAILDKLAAARLWPGGKAIGRYIRLDDVDPAKPSQDLEVVGLVGNVREHIIGSAPEPHVYIPSGQQYQSDVQIHVRTAGGGPDADGRMLAAVRQQIRAVDEHLPLLALKTMRSHLETGMDFWVIRTGARALEVFGAIALLLAVIGLYAVNAYAVARRTREIGIRMALGADPAVTLKMILRQGMRVTGVGMSAGLLLAIGIGQVLSGFLYGIHGFDPVVLVAAPMMLSLVASLACYIPARRASRVDPMIALRHT
jgi:predicted permease